MEDAHVITMVVVATLVAVAPWAILVYLDRRRTRAFEEYRRRLR